MFSSNCSQGVYVPPTPAPTSISEAYASNIFSGSGSTQSVVNGINMAAGGLMIVRPTDNASPTYWFDTVRGPQSYLCSNTSAQAVSSAAGTDLVSFNTDGFTLGTPGSTNVNINTWKTSAICMRAAPKFLCIRQYIGTGSAFDLAHDLTVIPGTVIIKAVDVASDWIVYSYGQFGSAVAIQYHLALNSNADYVNNTTYFGSTPATATTFPIGTSIDLNIPGFRYIVYLFAHDPSSTGWTASFGSAGYIPLFEPQAMLLKKVGYGASVPASPGTVDVSGDWHLLDSKLGMYAGVSTGSRALRLNSTTASITNDSTVPSLGSGDTTIPSLAGIALNAGARLGQVIARPSNAVATAGSQVFNSVLATGNATARSITGVGFSPDLILAIPRTGTAARMIALSDYGPFNTTTINNGAATSADWVQDAQSITSYDADGFSLGTSTKMNTSAQTYVFECFKRRREVCDIVTASSIAGLMRINHDLGVVPELIIAIDSWVFSKIVYFAALGITKRLIFGSGSTANSATGAITNCWGTTAPTATDFGVNAFQESISGSGASRLLIFALFATKAGISKIGHFTGNGTSQSIDCGFTTPPRFILIKGSNSVQTWFLMDNARGIPTSGNVTYSTLQNNAEASAAMLNATSTGFTVTGTTLNVNAAPYDFLAIA